MELQTAAIWIGMALLATLISLRIGMSVALIEICVGIAGGNLFGLHSTVWIDFLAAFGTILLAFLAGSEIDPPSLRAKWRETLRLGLVSFLVPFLAAMAFAYWVAGWSGPAAQIAGLSLATTSVALVYAIIVERGHSMTDLGRMMLAACFITDTTTILVLGLLFARFDWWLLAFAAVMVLLLWRLQHVARWFFAKVARRISEPETKFILVILFALGALASAAQSEAVLPAFLVGMVLAPLFLANRALAEGVRMTAFTVVTPFFFLKAGTLVSLHAVLGSAVVVGLFLAVKVAAKFLGVWPLARALRFSRVEATYLSLFLSTGLTFGSIAALYGLSHGLVTRDQYAILVTAIILSAVVPSLIAEQWFSPGQARPQEVLTVPQTDQAG